MGFAKFSKWKRENNIAEDYDLSILFNWIENVLADAEIDFTKPIHYCSNCGIDYDTREVNLVALLFMGRELRRVRGLKN